MSLLSTNGAGSTADNDKKSTAIYSEAISAINKALVEARGIGGAVANAASLATTGTNNKPSVRTVTICNVNEQGLLMFMNKNSGKAAHISYMPDIGLCFYWHNIQLQVSIEGTAIETTGDEASLWWDKQERNFQLSAWVSNKLTKPNNSGYVKQQRSSAKELFSDQRIPLPDSWVAYRIKPTRVEFWQVNWKSTSERICYECHDGEWSKAVTMS